MVMAASKLTALVFAKPRNEPCCTETVLGRYKLWRLRLRGKREKLRRVSFINKGVPKNKTKQKEKKKERKYVNDILGVKPTQSLTGKGS